MEAKIPIHPAGGASTGEYFTNEDGSVRIPALIVVAEVFQKIKSDIKSYRWRDDDFLLSSYPKSGTHFTWEIMTMLIRGSADYIEEPKQMAMIDGFPLSKSDEIFPSARVLNTHYRSDVLGPEFKKAKTVVVLRNPKDVCSSFYHHEIKLMPKIAPLFQSLADMPLSDFVKMFLFNKDIPYGTYLDYVAYMWSLRNEPNIFVVFYEDLKTDPVATIQKLNEYMGTGRSLECVQKIADATNFDRMKKAKQDHTMSAELLEKVHSVNGRSVEENKAGFKFLTEKIYRKGAIGDWKNQLTVADNEMFDAFLESWEEGKEISFKY